MHAQLSANALEDIADICDELDDMARRLANTSADAQPTHWPSGIAGWSSFLYIFCDASNKPTIVEYNGAQYAYVHTPQGNIVAILDSDGTAVVWYAYIKNNIPFETCEPDSVFRLQMKEDRVLCQRLKYRNTTKKL